MSSLHDLSAARLSADYAAGRLSPVEVTRAVLEHIGRCEPALNAMYLVHHDKALQAARESEARWRAAAPRSPIDGVPVTIKENIYTAGDPAPIGTAAGPLAPRPADAPPAARVREAGAVIVGKTTMPDFGMLSSGQSSMHGVTRNPWRLDLNLNPSGSSSGAGAAAAAGYGPLHIGTDIGGSVRLPATHCGIFGLKPSLGRIPVDPPYLGRVAGPMTRTVADAALLMDVLVRPDVRDFMSLPPQPGEYAAQLEGLSVRGLRIGVLPDMRVGLPVDAEVRAAFDDVAQTLARAGAIVEEIEPFFDAAMLDGIQVFFEARSCNDLAAMPPEQRRRILPFIVEWATWRARSFTGNDVMRGFAAMQLAREQTVRAIARHDFVLSPTSPVLPYSADLPSPSDDPHDALPHIAFTVPLNLSEQPAASVNWRASREGLPIGVQVIGQRFDDVGVLRLSRALELLRPAQQPWPQVPAR